MVGGQPELVRSDFLPWLDSEDLLFAPPNKRRVEKPFTLSMTSIKDKAIAQLFAVSLDMVYFF
jgi:hypothetical protein